ncbi:cellulose binding domain-containing protein [Actinoplanes sp. NPDC051411]|uniref:cellulose binding domain-containing protein n=1 Tax=Actinoplanes sp. NPDC051411 TaxID=3155522 RepID=UPI0034368C67
MAYRLGLVLGGAVLAVAGLVVGGTGASGATSVAPSAPPLTCPPILPISGAASAVTSDSVTISYSIFLGPPCGYDPPITVTLFASHDDAQQQVDPVGQAVSGPERSGQMTIGGLAPDTVYWFRFSAGAHADPYVFGSVRTAPVPVCAATVHVDSAWDGGFVATVAVRNVGSEALGSWHVSWRWPGDERIGAVWNAVKEGDAEVGNASYNGSLAPGGSATFGMLVASGGPPGEMALSCGR